MDERLRQRDLVKNQLIGLLEDVIAECEGQIDYIRRRGTGGLGGQLQNIWNIFYKLGELNILSADYLFTDSNSNSDSYIWNNKFK